MEPVGTGAGVTFLAMRRSRAAISPSMLSASLSARSAWPVNFWSAALPSHSLRLAAATARSSTRLIVTGAPFRFLGLSAIDGPFGNVQLEAHHGLVNAADLFHVEIAVAEPFAVEDEQLGQNPVDNAVRHARDENLRASEPARPSRNG